MSYKTILVELDDSNTAEIRIGIASSLAAEDAHVVGAVLAGNVAQTQRDGDLSAEAGIPEEANQRFRRVANRLGIRSIETRTIDGDVANAMSVQGCYCDLLVLGQDPGRGETMSQHVDFLEYVVLNAGCPVLVVPERQMRIGAEARVGSHVLVGWNASRSAGRAVRDAMPVLVRASRVDLMVINAGNGKGAQGKQGLHGEEPGADIALFLARHGVNVQVVQLIVDEEAGKTMLSFADRLSSNLIVAGGMAHPHAGRLLTGGATRTLLEHAHLPVLMSH